MVRNLYLYFKSFIRWIDVGVFFLHEGDEVVWVWPFKRKNSNQVYLSIYFQDYFSSLDELDKEWDAFFDILMPETLYNVVSDENFKNALNEAYELNKGAWKSLGEK